jgi:hypothetical protein
MGLPSLLPTATHPDADAHETALREVFVAPDGVGIGDTDQPLPELTSASGAVTAGEPPACEPTAMQNPVPAGHDTAFSTLEPAPGGSAAGSTRQAPAADAAVAVTAHTNATSPHAAPCRTPLITVA